ncbi:MAG: ABC transporter ATP-binding protein [Patescibacteria group bacterium]
MNAISVSHVDKQFYLQNQKTLKEMLQALVFGQKALDKVHALHDVSFTIKKGESVGILGKNGAGKSTLLKLIAGVSKPTNGTVEVNGKLAPLIELGAGFHPELSGRENIFLNGIILGLTEKEVSERVDEVVSFAGIEEFIDAPIKFYSSGMYVRLAFSIAVSTSPDILLIDEVLSVGDYEFQEKCMKRMETFKKNGVTVILVSHDANLVSSFCERAIILEQGKKVFDGDSKKAIASYQPQQ